MEVNSLTTERLVLRELSPAVYDFAFNNYNDQQKMEFFGFKTEDELTEEKRRYTKGFTTFNKEFLMFHIIEKLSGKVIGWCGYHTWYVPHSRAEIGYMLYSEQVMGKGYMKEALLPVINYGFNKMNLHRIEAFVGPDNVPSLKLIKQFGFKEEGRLREHYCKNGRLEDSVIFSLLKSEFNL